MMESRTYWQESGAATNYDKYNCNDGFGRTDQLNFATGASEDESEYPGVAYLKKGKAPRQDPTSHRIIEKRRRDRMNSCLADLSRMIPPEFVKKGRGRIEKTEIIEMTIRRLKFLQERANGDHFTRGIPRYVFVLSTLERQAGEEHFRAGYSEAMGEALRFLVEVRGYSPGDGLCLQMTSHMHKHVEAITKGEVLPREKRRSHPNSSSGNTSSSSSSGFISRGVISHAAPPPAPPPFANSYDQPLPMDCDRVSQMVENENLDSDLPLDGRRIPEPTLRDVWKPEHNDDYLQSYKFKNSIEKRFSRSQDNEITEVPAIVQATDMPRPQDPRNKVFTHKRRRVTKPVPSTSTSNSGSTEETREASPQDTTSSDSPYHAHYEKPTSQFVPIFALNSVGKYYVPLSVDYACLSNHLGPHDTWDAPSLQHPVTLHPVTIHVNFKSCMDHQVKREHTEDWRNQ